MHACMHPSVRIRAGHNSYIYGYISKLFDTVVVLEEEKCHLKFFSGRLKIKVTCRSHTLACLGHNFYMCA